MGLSCGAKCAKGLLIAFNLIFWVSGCVSFAAGVFFLSEADRRTLLGLVAWPGLHLALAQYLALALVALGGLVFLVGFCGCCGAVRESRPLLASYFIFLFLIMCGQLAVGILSVIFQDKTIGRLDELSSVLKEEYGINSQTTEALDFAQTKFNCCGVFGPADYEDSVWKGQDLGKGDNVAKTCCLLANTDHLDPRPLNDTWCQSQKESENIYFRHDEGCIGKLEEFIKSTSIVFVAIGCGTAALEIFGMIFAMCLCKEV